MKDVVGHRIDSFVKRLEGRDGDPSTERKSQVQDMLGLIDRLLSDAHGMMSEVQQRLQPVLRSEPVTRPENASGPKGPVEVVPLVPVAEKMQKIADGIDSLKDRLYVILQLLEV